VRVDFDPSNLTLARTNEIAPQAKGAASAMAPRSPAEEKKLKEAKDAAREFEQMFAEIMLKSMRSTATAEDESNAMDVYKGLLDTEYAKAMTDGGGLGIQDMVLSWMRESDPSLKGPGSGAPLPAGGPSGIGAANKALQQFRLQQYQAQAALPLLKE
jgi:flagellar protein FlgJ